MGVEENLAVVRRYLTWPGAPDKAERDRVHNETLDERCDFYPVRAFADPAPRHGRDEVRAFMSQFWEAWEQWQVDPVEVDAIDDVRVLARTRIQAVGRESGIELDVDLFHCFWLRNGRILRMEDHITEPGAREALGLRLE